MKTTTRKMTALQTTALQTTPASSPPPDPHRPLLPDAPDWFNRARDRANQRQLLGAEPVPFAGNCFVPKGDAARHRQILNKPIAVGLSLIALPAVFLMGFWTHRIDAPMDLVVAENDRHEVPSQDIHGHEVPAQDVAARNWNGELAQPFINLPSPPESVPSKVNFSLINLEFPNPIEQPPEVARRRRPPKPSTIAANLPTELEPVDRVVQNLAAVAVSEPVDGFALRSPVAGQFVADVRAPGNSWFSLAGATADCDSGTCKLIPVKTADRKLNTTLEWSASPQLAAEQAVREGKLVFLIHVSGNFSQPGFT